MRFTVTWRLDQQQKLARIWLSATDRRAVSVAANQIELLLAESPDTAGEEFYGDYLLAAPPLAVVYTISHADCRVQVLAVYHAGGIGE